MQNLPHFELDIIFHKLKNYNNYNLRKVMRNCISA